jgi:hypothetical protein
MARTWRDDEVELELPLIAVVDDVDAGIDVAILDLRIAADTRAPFARIVADQIIRDARKKTTPPPLCRFRRAQEPHRECGARPVRRPAHDEPGVALGQSQPVSRASRDELRIRGGRAGRSLEAQRHT